MIMAIIKMLNHFVNQQLPASPPVFTSGICVGQKCLVDERIYGEGNKIFSLSEILIITL
jgi:hypothetical protein